MTRKQLAEESLRIMAEREKSIRNWLDTSSEADQLQELSVEVTAGQMIWDELDHGQLTEIDWKYLTCGDWPWMILGMCTGEMDVIKVRETLNIPKMTGE